MFQLCQYLNVLQKLCYLLLHDLFKVGLTLIVICNIGNSNMHVD